MSYGQKLLERGARPEALQAQRQSYWAKKHPPPPQKKARRASSNKK